jgi:hypothetical protein
MSLGDLQGAFKGELRDTDCGDALSFAKIPSEDRSILQTNRQTICCDAALPRILDGGVKLRFSIGGSSTSFLDLNSLRFNTELRILDKEKKELTEEKQLTFINVSDPLVMVHHYKVLL